METGLNTLSAEGGEVADAAVVLKEPPPSQVPMPECSGPKDCLFAHDIEGQLELARGGWKSPADWI